MILRLLDDEWVLEDSDGEIVGSGDYPLKENTEFIENAAELLNNWQYHRQPYQRVDERGP